MPDYPRPCPKCGLSTERDGFALDRSKASGRKSHCKSCDRRKAHAYYDAHKDEMRLARRPTLAFVGWFGPRGLATIVFAVILIDESSLPHERTLLLAVVATIGISVFAHGSPRGR